LSIVYKNDRSTEIDMGGGEVMPSRLRNTRRSSARWSVAVLTALLTPVCVEAAAWSPDGRQLAYSFIGGPESIFLVDVDGANVIELVARPQRDFRPEWAPDGSKLTFTTALDGVHVMMQVDRDGGGLQALSRPEDAEGDPHISPDGERLLFFTDEPRPRDLYVREIASGRTTALTATADFDEYSPRWAPDGRRVVFVGKPHAENSRADIWTLDTITGERHCLAATPQVDEFHPAWSPDGARVVYIRNVDGRFSVGVRELASGTERVVADGNGYAVLDPHFSPDGRSLTFTRTDFEEKGEGMPAIVRLDLESRSETVVVRGRYLSQLAAASD